MKILTKIYLGKVTREGPHGEQLEPNGTEAAEKAAPLASGLPNTHQRALNVSSVGDDVHQKLSSDTARSNSSCNDTPSTLHTY